MAEQVPNLELELQLCDQLELLDDLIENLKLHSLVMAMAVSGSKVISPDEMKKNKDECLRMRKEIELSLGILNDIKEKSFDEIGPLGQLRVEQSIKRCNLTIKGFDNAFSNLLREGEISNATLPLMLEQILVRSKRLEDNNERITDYMISDKVSLDFDMYSSEDVAEVIHEMKEDVKVLDSLLKELSDNHGKVVPELTELVRYVNQTIDDYETKRRGTQ